MTKTLLEKEITEEDRQNYFKAQLEKDLALPFNSLIHQRLLNTVSNISDEELRKKFMNRIWGKFYASRNILQ